MWWLLTRQPQICIQFSIKRKASGRLLRLKYHKMLKVHVEVKFILKLMEKFENDSQDRSLSKTYSNQSKR